MAIDNAIASVAVRDIARATEWYSRLFGRGPDTRPMTEIAEWKFGRGGWLQVYALPERAGHGSCTLAVTDLPGEIAKLAALGIDTSNQSSGATITTLMITDPDGNHLAFAETTSPGFAR